MDNFDFKKYLAKNPLNEVYTPGSGWTQDFDYDDMLAQGLKVTVDTPVEDLEKMFADFEDVNYHREGEHLSYAIDAIKSGDRGEAKMYINKFRKEIKKTIADYSDEYFDVNEGREGQFDVEATERIAQKIADAFTAEDTDLDLKYVVTPGTSENSFDLDVEAGPNTPGDDWKDKNGFGIENYLGQYAGGSFYIKDGVVYNAAVRNAPVAKVSPEGKVEMISAEESRAAIGMEENKEETKPNKMKKSELKEMIKTAMLAEMDINVKDETNMYDPVDEGMINETTAMEFMELLPTVAGGMAALIGSSLGVTVFMEKAKEGKYGAKIQKLAQGLEGIGSTAAGARNVAEQEDVEVEDDENVDVNIDKDVEVDVDDESTETDTVVKTELPGESKDVEKTLGLLTKAQQTAKELGDEKLTDQIGNTITYFTRAHVARQSVNESIEFPMWNKIK